MKEVLTELINGNSILIEKYDLPEFWDYISEEKDYYSFSYDYSDKLVKITLTGKHTIIKL